MPLETLEPQVYDELSRDLNDLSRQAVQSSVKDPETALDLARAFEKWTFRARKVCGEWSGAFHRQAQETITELKSGLPAARAMEQILRTLLQAHRLLEKEQKGEAEKETDVPAISLPLKAALDDASDFKEQLYVRPEDQGLFQLFLQEAPTFLSGIQSNLLLLSSRQKADFPQVYQLFHVLQGQWGFLGFFQMRQLCQAAEMLLEPFLRGPQAPSPEDLDVLLMALGSCRSQVDRIARGLSRELVEVFDAAPVMEELKRRVASQVPPEGARVVAPVLENEGYFQIRDEQMESLLALMGDLVFSQSSFLEETLALNLKGKSAADAARITKVTRQMRDLLLSLRMVPLRPLFEQISWTLMRFSQEAEKTVYLAVESPDIEVDKQLLPILADLLAPLVKNAVDHGIETAEERMKKGKLPEGQLKMKASLQAGSVILEVEDDGRGLDLEKLRRKGRALGILGDEKAGSARVMEMIFKPGVTTLENAEESRGLGLDRVEEQVENLHGSIRVQSKAGQGCKFILKIPRTQALIEGWVVEASGKSFLLPLSQVRKITHPSPPGAEKENPPEDGTVPALDLGEWFSGEKRGDAPKFSVHVESGYHQFRVLVDEVHGKQQVLVRKAAAGGIAGVRAEALLPEGKTVWVLDTRQFAQWVEKTNG